MRMRIFGFGLGLGLVASIVASAQDVHNHTPAVSGVPQGVPYFCANPSVTSIVSGAWSDSKTWSTGKVPGANDKVKIAAGHSVILDTVSDARLACIEVDGALRFATDANTRVKAGNLMVMDEGNLEVGTAAKPVASKKTRSGARPAGAGQRRASSGR